jgi:Spy/CpxP family protein refolding chaperone
MTGPRGLIVAISASLITGCAIGLIAGVLFARAVMFPHPFGHRPHGGPPGPRMARFVEQRLGLSAEQSTRFEAILDRARSRADSLHEEARVQILAILTPDQRERWERMNHRMFPGGGPRGEPFDHEPGGPPPPPPPDSAP